MVDDNIKPADEKLPVSTNTNSSVAASSTYDAAIVNQLRARAASGDMEAQFLVGSHYEKGEGGFPVHFEKAKDYYLQAAQSNHPEAFLALGKLQLERLKNPKLAFQYVKQSAEQFGSPESQFILSQLYAYGHGCPRNEGEAKRFFRRARFQIAASDHKIEAWLIHGKELCDFEEQKGLSIAQLSLSDRIQRHHRDTISQIPNEQIQIDLQEFSRIASAPPPTPYLNTPLPLDGFPIIQKRAIQGSVIAQNFLRSLYLRLLVVTKLCEEKLTEEEIDGCLEAFLESWELNDLLTGPGPELCEVSSQRLEQDPNHVNAALVLGLFFHGSNSERVDYWKRFVAQHGKVADGHHMLGCAYAFNSEVSLVTLKQQTTVTIFFSHF